MQHLAPMLAPVDAITIAAWHTLHVCTNDESLSVDLHRNLFAPRCEEVIQTITR
jgi:hypothetical protein